MYIIKEDNN